MIASRTNSKNMKTKAISKFGIIKRSCLSKYWLILYEKLAKYRLMLYENLYKNHKELCHTEYEEPNPEKPHCQPITSYNGV